MSKKNVFAIVFAAGKGSRLAPLTETIPKPLLDVNGKTLLEFNLEKISPFVSKFVIIVSYLGEQIIQKLGQTFDNKPIEYVWQKNPKGGTLDALRTGIFYGEKDNEQADYFIINSDDIHDNQIYDKMLAEITQNPNQALVAGKILEDREKLKSFGVYEIDSDNLLVKVWEKPQEYISNLINIGIYYFPNSVIDFIDKELNQSDKEHFITDHLFNPYLQKNPIKVVSTTGEWLPVTSVADLESVRKRFEPARPPGRRG